MQIGNFDFSVINLKFKPIDKDYQFYSSYYRGMLGRSLKKRFCVLKDMKCEECPLNDKCLYMLSFEKYKDVLFPPYIINRSSKDSLRITLIGSFTQFSEVYMDAFKRLYLKEFGFYNPFTKTVGNQKLIFNTRDFENIELPINISELLIKFVRLKKDSKMLSCDNLDFEAILKAVEKRIYLINKYYGNPENKVYVPQFNGNNTKQYCRYEKIYRYSNRQKRSMLIPSISSGFEIEGDLKELYPYLYLSTFLNIGTNASMGFGQVSLNSNPF